MEDNAAKPEEKKSANQIKKALTGSRNLKTRIISVIVVAVILVLTAVSAWAYGGIAAKKNAEQQLVELNIKLDEQEQLIRELKETPIVVTPVAPRIELDIIYSEIKDIAELATLEYLFTDAGRFSDSKQIKDWNIPFTEKSFVMKWNGKIKAGVKLDEVSIEVDEETKKITVWMPKAEILSYEVDNDSVEILDEQNNIFNNITVDDKVQFDGKTEAAMKQRAIENGILENAQKNAQDILRRLLISNSAIGTDYTIVFQQKDAD